MAMERKTYLFGVHHLRAFAIVNIMFVHLWVVPPSAVGAGTASLIDMFRESLFHDSTVYFLFISGFLFYYLSENFSIRRYFVSKLSFVFSPYLIYTLFLTIYSGIALIRDGHISSFLSRLLSNVLLGKAVLPYWYIPFIMTIFLISPLLLKVPKKAYPVIAIAAFVLPLSGTRTYSDISIGQYVFFLPVYVLGVCSAVYYSEMLLLVKRFKKALLAIVVASLVLVFVFIGRPYLGPFNIYEALQYLNKITVTFLALSWLTNREPFRIRILDLLAEYSFPLYFSHAIANVTISRMLYSSMSRLVTPSSSLVVVVPLSILFVVCRIALTLLVCMTAKRLLGKYSRYFIGT